MAAELAQAPEPRQFRRAAAQFDLAAAAEAVDQDLTAQHSALPLPSLAVHDVFSRAPHAPRAAAAPAWSP